MEQVYTNDETMAVYECVFNALTGKFPNGGFDVMLRENADATAIQGGAQWPGARVLTNVDISDFGPDCNLADYQDGFEFACMALDAWGPIRCEAADAEV